MLTLVFVFSIQSYAQQLQTYSFEQVEVLVKKYPKPILLYFYTDWCKYCKMMQQTTFKDKKVVEKLNKDYYVILFDGMAKQEIVHQQKKFKFVYSGIKTGYHKLIYHYLNGRQEVYPTLIFLNQDFKELLFLQTYISSKKLLEIL